MDDKLLLKPEEAAHRLGLSRARVYELITPRAGQAVEIESITIGRSRRIPVQALTEFVTRQREESRVPA